MISKPCVLVINTRFGHVCAPLPFDSIAAAVRYAKGENGGYWFRVFVGSRVVRRGYCG